MRSMLVGLVGVGCLSGFAWFLWEPAALVPVGVACLVYDWMHP